MPPSSCPAPFAGSLRSGVSPARRRPVKRKATRARSAVRRKDAQAEGEGHGPFGSRRLPSPPERAKRRYRTSWAKVGTHESKNELPPPNLFGLVQCRRSNGTSDAPLIKYTTVHFVSCQFTVQMPAVAVAAIGLIIATSLVWFASAAGSRIRKPCAGGAARTRLA